LGLRESLVAGDPIVSCFRFLLVLACCGISVSQLVRMLLFAGFRFSPALAGRRCRRCRRCGRCRLLPALKATRTTRLEKTGGL
jgi:hypothetical protein